MPVINVFLTNTSGDTYDAFEHGDLRVTFASMGSEGPRRLIDGTIMAYVDWVLPDISGFEMCRRLRANPATSNAHIIMVLERDHLDDRRRALEAGADNYIVGPLERNSVLDHILTMHSNNGNRHNTRTLVLGDLTLNSDSYLARWQGEPIDLPPNLFRLMRFFAERPNQLLTRKAVIEGLGKMDRIADERTVDVWVGRLRRSLIGAGVDIPLRTVRGQGYVLDLP